jgi:hypothetical protein
VYQGNAYSGPSVSDPRYPCHSIVENCTVYNNICEHNDTQECECVNNLVLFQIDKALFDELAQIFWKRKYYEMSIFLSHLDFVQTMHNDQIDTVSKFTTTKTYAKGELVFEESDYPLQSFFIVKKGSVNLNREISIEQCNFIPTTLTDYERRFKQKTVAHTLGVVKVY